MTVTLLGKIRRRKSKRVFRAVMLEGFGYLLS